MRFENIDFLLQSLIFLDVLWTNIWAPLFDQLVDSERSSDLDLLIHCKLLIHFFGLIVDVALNRREHSQEPMIFFGRFDKLFLVKIGIHEVLVKFEVTLNKLFSFLGCTDLD